MKKILIIMSVGSHQNATFNLAKKLTAHGYKVVYAGTRTGIYNEDLEANIVAQGFSYELLDPYKYDKSTEANLKSTDPTNEFINFANNIYGGELFSNFMCSVQPDIILLDIHLPIYAIALFPFKIPVLFISTELSTDRSKFNPPLASNLIPQVHKKPEMVIEAAWDEYLTQHPLHPAVKHLIQELSYSNGFPLDQYFQEKCIVMFGLKYPEIILWPQEFEFYSNQLHSNNRYYVGNYVDINRNENKFDWSIINSERPLIYCALGTVVNHDLLTIFLSKLILAFEHFTEYEFIISAGRVYEKLKTSNRNFNNIHIYQYVPQLTVLRKSALMITLGGANSIKESMSLGVPLLCYPFHSDQFGNAARVAHHKLGLRGDVLRDSSETIKSKIEEIMRDESFRKNMKKFQGVFNKYESEDIPLTIINSLVDCSALS